MVGIGFTRDLIRLRLLEIHARNSEIPGACQGARLTTLPDSSSLVNSPHQGNENGAKRTDTAHA